MTGKATEEALDALHGLLAGTLAEQLKAAREKKDEQGKPAPVPTALLAEVAKFLKQNGIDTPARSQRMDGLARELEQLDLDEAARERLN